MADSERDASSRAPGADTSLSPDRLLRRSVTDSATSALASARTSTSAADVAGGSALVLPDGGSSRNPAVAAHTTHRPAHGALGGRLSPPPAAGTPERQLHQRLQRTMGSVSGASPTPSPRSALRQLDPEGGHRPHAPLSSGSGSGAMPIHLEGRSYRFSTALPVDSPSAGRAHLSTSAPEEPEGMAQYSSSYTATSNTIRDSTALLASMALYGDDDDDDDDQAAPAEGPPAAGGSGRWRGGSTSSGLSSGFHFQAAKASDATAEQDQMLSTSPRARPQEGNNGLVLDRGPTLTSDEGQAIPISAPLIVKSPPAIDDDETPRLGLQASRSTMHHQSDSNAGTTDTGSDFSVRAPNAPQPFPADFTNDSDQEDARRSSAPAPQQQQRQIAFAEDLNRLPPREGHLPRRTSIDGAMPQDIFPGRSSSSGPGGPHVFQPSSFSGFAGHGRGQRATFGFGALAQAQAEAEQASQGGGSGVFSSGGGGYEGRGTASAIQLPGGYAFGHARASGVGGRRGSVARPSVPGTSSLSLYRTWSSGRRSFAYGSSAPADSQYGSIFGGEGRDDAGYERGRQSNRHDGSEHEHDDERQALLGGSGGSQSWRNVLGGQEAQRPHSRSRAAAILSTVTYPVRAVGKLFSRSHSQSRSRSRSRSHSPARSSLNGAAHPSAGADTGRLSSTRERIRKSMTRDNVKAALMEPITVLPAVVLGLLLNLLDGVSYGMIAFPNSNPIFAHFGGDGVAMFFVTCIISQLVYSLGGSVFKAGNGSMMIEVVPFYHILVRKIIEEIGDSNPAAVIATTCMAMALSSVLTGLVFLLLGLLRLGVLIGFFPRHILVGCIGGVGIFLLETGFEVAGRLESEGGFQYNLETLKYFFQSTHMVALWLTPLSLAILLRLITARFNHPLVVPAYFVLMPALFYGIAFPLGMNLLKLRKDGWVFDIGNAADAPFWRFYTYFDLTQTSWMALVATMPTQFALIFLSILHPPLNIPALAVSVGQDDVNTDRELTAHGWSNIIAGAHILLPALGFLIGGKRLEA
ncbi:hypothetical protein OC844_000748 [Tilletia horrida]|nr:hypothetical protein OC844_000748 [Tilletia horrida]